MNLKSIVSPAAEGVITVACVFKTRAGDIDEQREFNFKCPRTLAETLTPGNSVLVEIGSGVSIVIVKEVHDESVIDPDDRGDYNWLFAAVPLVELEALKAAEDKIVKDLINRRRKAVRAKMKALLDGDGPLLLDGKEV